MELAEGIARSAARLSQTRSVGELEREGFACSDEILGEPKTALYLLDPDSGAGEHLCARGASDELLTRYEEVGREVDPLLGYTVRTHRAVRQDSLMTRDEALRHPQYQLVGSIDGITHLLQAPVIANGRMCGTLLYAGTDARDPFTADDERAAESLALVVGAALAALRMRERLARGRDAAVAALSAADEAVVVSERGTGRVLENPAARAILDLVAWSSARAQLDELIAASGRRPDGGPTSLAVQLSDGRRGILRVRTVASDDAPGVLASFLRLDVPGDRPLPSSLAEQLTPRERDVARLAAGGYSDKHLAAALGISAHTVNQHLKSVFGKLGVSSRIELSALARDVARTWE